MSFINSLYFLFLTYNLCLAEIRRRRTLFLMELAPVYKRHFYYIYTNKAGDCVFIFLSFSLFVYGRPNRKA